MNDLDTRIKTIVQETTKPAAGNQLWIDGREFSVTLQEDDGFSDEGFPGCQFRLPSGTAINIKVTGRTFQRYGTFKFGQAFSRVRVQIEFVGDCEPSTFVGGWIEA